MKFSFKLPVEKDIIIFDKECSDQIIEKVFKENYQYSILDNRPLIYLNLLFIIRYIYLLIKNLNFKEKITRQLFHIYFLNIVGYINPKVVITYIDDNSIYSWLTKNYNDCEFIAIQNGNRGKCDQIKLNNKNHQHYYCFGDYDIKKQSDLGCTIDKGYPVGSFRSGLVLSNSKLSNKNKKYDICIISSGGRRHPDSIKESFHGHHQIIDAVNNRKIDRLVKKYIVENNLKLAIALSTDTDYEKKYFKSMFGENIELIEHRHSLSSYEAIYMSNISISFMSTMILEAIGLGNKGLSIHFEDTDLYFDYPKEIKYLYKDYTSFNKYMNGLLDMRDHEYTNKMKVIKKYIMNNDPKNPPHSIIKKHIEDIIEERK